MSGSLKVYPPAPGTTMRVHLRDEGQDFLWLDIQKDGVIADAGPFQGWLWRGKHANHHGLKVGRLVPVLLNKSWTTLKYPITKIEKIAA